MRLRIEMSFVPIFSYSYMHPECGMAFAISGFVQIKIAPNTMIGANMKTNIMMMTALLSCTAVVNACGSRASNQSSLTEAKDASPRAPEADPFLVKSVDLKRYIGEWYEIASLPRPFQSFCSKTKAKYEFISANEISVVNTCKVGFAPIAIQGTARVVDNNTNAVLEVSLANKKADYRIIALDPNYQHALVTNKDRSSLFVLSRTLELDDAVYASLLERAKLAGVDVTKVKKTQQ